MPPKQCIKLDFGISEDEEEQVKVNADDDLIKEE